MDMVHEDRTVRVRLFGILEDLLVKMNPANFAENLFWKVNRR